ERGQRLAEDLVAGRRLHLEGDVGGVVQEPVAHSRGETATDVRPKTSAKWPAHTSAISGRLGALPVSRSIEVICTWCRPQGMMPAKYERSVETFSAKPCVVTQRERWTPIEAIFFSPTQTPMSSCASPGSAVTP